MSFYIENKVRRKGVTRKHATITLNPLAHEIDRKRDLTLTAQTDRVKMPMNCARK